MVNVKKLLNEALQLMKMRIKVTYIHFIMKQAVSAEEHTGWYVMLEKGTPVQIVFPTEDENQVYTV